MSCKFYKLLAGTILIFGTQHAAVADNTVTCPTKMAVQALLNHIANKYPTYEYFGYFDYEGGGHSPTYVTLALEAPSSSFRSRPSAAHIQSSDIGQQAYSQFQTYEKDIQTYEKKDSSQIRLSFSLGDTGGWNATNIRALAESISPPTIIDNVNCCYLDKDNCWNKHLSTDPGMDPGMVGLGPLPSQ